MSVAQEVRGLRTQSNALTGLGIILRERQETDSAIQRFEEAIAVARQHGDLDREAWAKWNLGLLHDRMGHFARAVELMQPRIDLRRRTGHADADKDAALVASIRAKLSPRRSRQATTAGSR